METKKRQKNDKKYFCKICDYYTNKKTDYNRHLQTKKHNGNVETKWKQKNDNICICQRVFKTRSGLYKHKKTCTYIPQETVTQKESEESTPHTSMEQMFIQLMEKNQELQEQILELASQPKTVINNQNNSFNLNNFLNVQCKDAMNLSEFLEQINISFEDLLYLGNNGFVESFKKTFMKQLKDLDQTKRPIHCTDQKRKACVVKEDDKWHKDDTNEFIYKAVDKVNRKQIDAFSRHAKNRDKDFLDDDTNLDNNSKIIIEMCGYNQKNADAIHKKIMKHISDNTYIKKSL